MMIGLVWWCVGRKMVKLIVQLQKKKIHNRIPNIVNDYCWDEYKKGGK